jgi:hypothetical protein
MNLNIRALRPMEEVCLGNFAAEIWTRCFSESKLSQLYVTPQNSATLLYFSNEQVDSVENRKNRLKPRNARTKPDVFN